MALQDEYAGLFKPSYQTVNIPGATPQQSPNPGLPGYKPPGSDKGFSLGDYTKLGTGIADAYLGYQGLDLGRKQFDFAKGSFNVNLANQAQLINNEMESRQRARLETSGQYSGQPGGQANLQADLQSYLKPRQVSGAPI
jgi:hypothetical protein